MGVKSLHFLTICSSRPQPSKRDAKRGVRSRSVLLQIAVDVVVVVGGGGGGGGCRRGVVGIIAVVAVGVVALPLSANPTGEDVCSKGVACRRLAPGAGWPSLGVSHLAPNLQVGEFGICKALSGNASVVVRFLTAIPLTVLASGRGLVCRWRKWKSTNRTTAFRQKLLERRIALLISLAKCYLSRA